MAGSMFSLFIIDVYGVPELIITTLTIVILHYLTFKPTYACQIFSQIWSNFLPLASFTYVHFCVQKTLVFFVRV